MSKYQIGPSDIHGRGLFATQEFVAGELVGIYTGSIVIVSDDPHVLWVEDHDGRQFGIQGSGMLSYMNHSDEPNAVVAAGGPFVYAAHEIEADDEITIDYGEHPEED